MSRGRHKTIAQRVPRTKRRKNLTLVATICDCPILQTTLPQFIIGNRATFKARQIHALRSACPANVILLRSKSAWNNEETMIDIIGALRNALAPHMDRVQPVLILDAAAIHLGGELFFALISVGGGVCCVCAEAVLNACKAADIWFICVPPRLTWRLQPLDTHCFLALKTLLHQLYQQARARAGQDHLNLSGFLLCLYVAMKRVLCGRPWARAFDDDGYSALQLRVHADTLKQLQITTGLSAVSAGVTAADVTACFPVTLKRNAELAWRLFLGRSPLVSIACGADGNS